jgi:hypothetical protein
MQYNMRVFVESVSHCGQYPASDHFKRRGGGKTSFMRERHAPDAFFRAKIRELAGPISNRVKHFFEKKRGCSGGNYGNARRGEGKITGRPGRQHITERPPRGNTASGRRAAVVKYRPS